MSHSQANSAKNELRAGIGDLRAFVSVAHHGAVARAAESLGRTQPSVSARLASLESAWKTKLFRRVARGMELTPEGARLLPMAESILHDLERLEHQAGVPHGRKEELRLGAGDALGRRLLPRALAKLLGESPSIDVRLREGNGQMLIDSLREGEIDLALIVAPAGESVGSGLQIEPLFSSPVALLCPPDWIAASEQERSVDGEVTLSDLDDEPLVTLQQGSSFRRHLEAQFNRESVKFQAAVEVGNLSLVRRFVMTGLGVAAVPEIAFSTRPRPSRYAMKRIVDIDPVHYAYAVRSGVPLPDAVQRLLERLRQPRAA
jgi:DNA-binding transcriptional LysR family regulator